MERRKKLLHNQVIIMKENNPEKFESCYHLNLLANLNGETWDEVAFYFIVLNFCIMIPKDYEYLYTSTVFKKSIRLYFYCIRLPKFLRHNFNSIFWFVRVSKLFSYIVTHVSLGFKVVLMRKSCLVGNALKSRIWIRQCIWKVFPFNIASIYSFIFKSVNIRWNC